MLPRWPTARCEESSPVKPTFLECIGLRTNWILEVPFEAHPNPLTDSGHGPNLRNLEFAYAEY